MSQNPTKLEAFARAYDREDASQRGEPDPWDDGKDDTAWVAERLACAQAGFAALSASQEAAAPSEEPVAWCQPMDCGKHTPRKFIVRFEDADKGDAIFDDEAEARDYWERANGNWNCYLFGALPRDPSPAVSPVAWRVLAEPDLPVHFALTEADAKHLVNNLLTYRRGCTSARIDPLYSFETVATKP